MKKIVSLAALLVMGAGAYAYLMSGQTDDKAVAEQVPVSVGDVTQIIPAIGTLTALRTVRVGSQVSGTVKELYADYNTVVKKGQIIAELDASLLEVQVAVQEASIASLESDIAHQKVQLDDDQKNLTRAQTQFDKGLVSQQQLETAQLRVKTRASQISSAERQKIQTEARLNQAKLNVAYCTIRSPIDGVVVNRWVDKGQIVQASMNTPQFFTIATDLTTLKILAGVDEADISHIRPHMPVTFSVGSYKDEQFTGEVEAVRLNAQNQNNVVTYPVWITAPNADLRLRPSMTATMKIIVGTANRVVRVPNQALKFRATSTMYGWFGLPTPSAGSSPRAALPIPGARANEPAANDVVGEMTPMVDRDANTIDELFPPVPKRVTANQVWVYDERQPDEEQRLRAISVRTGLSDGEFSEVVSGELKPGMQVMTGVVPPVSALAKAQSTLFGGPQRGRGGMTQADPQGPTRLAPRGGGGGGRGGGRGGG